MNTSEIKKADGEFIANTYARFDLLLDSAEDGVLLGEDKKYIDFGSGIGVSAFGVSDKLWADAVCAQARKLSHTSNLYYTAPCVELAKKLCARTGMKKVFFGNSGAEANECAIKTARKYSCDKYGADAKRYTIVTLVNSFHGRTMLTLAATGQDVFHTDFYPFPEGFKHTPANDIEALKVALTDDVCALMIECVQGEGGVLPLEAEFIKAARELCDELDILLIVDEVQTGNGRTGALYAYMNFGITPDIVTTAKGLGGGLPIGACMMGEKVENTMTAGKHGSTFGGNPIAAAGAVTVIDRLDEAFLATVRVKSAYLKEKLSKINGIHSVSGMGLMLGLEVDDAKTVLAKCLERGLLVLTAKTKLRLLPPLNVTYEQLDEAVAIIADALSE
ncbi:MAG: aspartate aminotransferase family protein [Ruminococcaceae bacterium]|nr:aspartate aminotransferase family protein [Oscillospiraceae bacterium]